MQRWRTARDARADAHDRLIEAELDAGVRRRSPAPLRWLLGMLAVLALAGAGLAVWQAVDASRGYSDAQLVDAARDRVELLLTADATDPGRAKRILDGATGEFYDSFAQSAEGYTQFIEQQGGQGEARIDGAALVSRDDDRGVVLLAATLRNRQQQDVSRQVRLRVLVEPEDGVLKLAGVVFVP